MNLINNENHTAKLKEFAVKVTREICIRTSSFAGDNDNNDEIRWAKEGPVSVEQLDTVRKFII